MHPAPLSAGARAEHRRAHLDELAIRFEAVVVGDQFEQRVHLLGRALLGGALHLVERIEAGAVDDVEVFADRRPEGFELDQVDRHQGFVGRVVLPNVRAEALGVDAVQVEIPAWPQELNLPVRAVALQDVEIERGRHRPFETQGDEELGVLGVVDAPHRQRPAEDPMGERQDAIDVLAHGQVDIEPDQASRMPVRPPMNAPHSSHSLASAIVASADPSRHRQTRLHQSLRWPGTLPRLPGSIFEFGESFTSFGMTGTRFWA